MRRLSLLLIVVSLAACGGSTPTPAGALDANGVVAALKAAGLSIGQVKVYDASSDPNSLLGRPGQYTSKVAFTDANVATSDATDPFDLTNGGSVEVFASRGDATKRKDYIATVTAGLPVLTEYDYLDRSGTVLLRLGHTLTPDQATAYQQALATLP